MGKTITEKILSGVSGSDASPGDIIVAPIHACMAHDGTAPLAIRAFREMGAKKVWDPKRVALIIDHIAPSSSEGTSDLHIMMRKFAAEHGIRLFDVGEGICHQLMPEKGYVVPGRALVGADSHTCTYGAVGAFSTGVGSTDMAAGMALGTAWFKVPAALRFRLEGELSGWAGGKDLILAVIGLIGVDGALYRSMEFDGPGVRTLSMDERFTVANMAIEAGAKNGIFPVDDRTRAWAASVSDRPYVEYAADADAAYEREITIDLGSVRPTIAFPHLPSNARPAAGSGDVALDQVVIGSCTNGRLSDLRVAASILRGRRVAKGLRCIVFPATQRIYLDALREGLIETFIEAGAVVSTPTCGPCLGGHMGILAAGERAVATTNRNFVGRMGHPSSEVYLASPATAAACAVAGRLCDPSDVMEAPARATQGVLA